MAFRLQVILIVGMIISILLIFRLIGNKKLNFKLGLSWVLISLIIMVFAAWPALLLKCSKLLGIYSPVNMIFLFGFILLVFIVVFLSMEVSKLTEQNKRLSQELAILRKDTYDSINRIKNDRE